MSKSAKLKSRLKASDRRRRRRDVGGSSSYPPAHTGATQTQPQVDVAGLLAEAALRLAERSPQVRDATIYAALNCLATQSTPKKEATAQVLDEMTKTFEASAIPPKDARRAARELCLIAKQNMSPDDADQFLRYLALITE